MNKHYMIDIETTGTDKQEDEILEVALVEIELKDYWELTGREYSSIFHSTRVPQTSFAKKHMAPLYKRCNEASMARNNDSIGDEMCAFVHNIGIEYLREEPYIEKSLTPKYFMGWNASNFDIPFIFEKNLLTPSWYQAQPDGSEQLRGDVHYRIYEQTGALQLMSDVTGFSRNTLQSMAMDLNPTGIELPGGELHDALYDCYRQVVMMNGLIKIGRDLRVTT